MDWVRPHEHFTLIAFCDQHARAWTIPYMSASLFTAAHKELVSAIIRLRTDAGMTQRELAAKVGREQNFIARIETHQRRVDLVEF